MRKLPAVKLVGTMLLSLGLAVSSGARAHAQGAAAPAAAPKAEVKTEIKTEPKAGAAPDRKAGDKDSVGEHVKKLGREVKDPGTLQRIKGHEQDLEKRVERKRDSQRKDHGAARPGDAVDLAKSLDKTGGAGDAQVKPDSKKKVEAVPAAPSPPPPAATSKPAPAPTPAH
jgi:hypothetical protein